MTRMTEVLIVLAMMILFPTEALGEEVMIDWDARRVALGHEENCAFWWTKF